jgi:HAD superfamily hydrolase (TIGR01509 family)
MALKMARMFNWKCARVAQSELSPLHDVKSPIQTVLKKKQGWKVVDTVHGTLTGLKARGFALGIVSNFDETLPELCVQFRLTPYFDAIVVSSIVGVEKPDPEILNIACRQLGVNPSASLYVGDHPFDLLCAKNRNVGGLAV